MQTHCSSSRKFYISLKSLEWYIFPQLKGWLYDHLQGEISIIVMIEYTFYAVDTQGYELVKDFEKRIYFGPSLSDHKAVMVLNVVEYFS